MMARRILLLAGLILLSDSLRAADIVIKPFDAAASTYYGGYVPVNTINDANTDIETGDPIPGTWPSLSVAKGSCWIHDGNASIDDEWIAFDLGAYYNITGAQLWRYYAADADDRLLKDFHILFAETLSGDFSSAALDTNDFSGAVTPTPLGMATNDPDPGVSRTFDSPVGMAVRYVLIDIDTNYGDPYVGLGEVRFTGTETNDVYAPGLVETDPFFPPDNEIAVSIETALIATFNESVALSGSGSITLTDLTDGSSTETISLPDVTRVTVSGTELTIQPPSGVFEGLTEFSVRVSSNAVEDLASPPNSFAGIADDTTWTFTTADADRFVILPTNAVASSEYSGRPAVDAINSHGVDASVIETGDPIPYPWPTANTSKTESWMTESVGVAAVSNQWITFDLGDVYSIDGIYAWNYLDVNNGNNGIQDVDILFAVELSDTFGSGASVSNDYSSAISKTFAKATRPHMGELLDLDSPVAARYVLFDIASNHGSSYVGLSELRFTGKTYVQPPPGTILVVR